MAETALLTRAGSVTIETMWNGLDKLHPEDKRAEVVATCPNTAPVSIQTSEYANAGYIEYNILLPL